MEKEIARNWYWWLWLSPLVTALTLAWFATLYQEPAVTPLSVLGSSLWHLILLFPTFNRKSEFVRWHGRQALLLAGVRTVVPLGFVFGFGTDDPALISIPVLIAVWFFGTLWGQRQAARGKCGLMRWFGRADAQPSHVDALVDVIRFSRDPEERDKALAKLQELGMVEPL